MSNTSFIAHYTQGWYYLQREVCHPNCLILIPWRQIVHYTNIYMCRKDGYVYGECVKSCHKFRLFLMCRLIDTERILLLRNLLQIQEYINPKLRDSLKNTRKIETWG